MFHVTNVGLLFESRDILAIHLYFILRRRYSNIMVHVCGSFARNEFARYYRSQTRYPGKIDRDACKCRQIYQPSRQEQRGPVKLCLATFPKERNRCFSFNVNCVLQLNPVPRIACQTIVSLFFNRARDICANP